MEKGDMIYWARIMPQTGTYDVIDLKLRTVAETYFVGVDNKTSQAYPFAPKDIGEILFTRREDAVDAVKEAQEINKTVKFTIDKSESEDE